MKRELRFGVRERDLTGSTWKLWTETTARQLEVYLVNRNLRGELKASMHQEGGWHIAHSKEYFENEVRGYVTRMPTRYQERWTPPEALVPGVTHAFQIVTPSASVVSPIQSDDRNRGIVWIQNPSSDRVTLIDIFLVSPGYNLVSNAMVVGTLSLTNGASAVVACWTGASRELGIPPDLGTGEFYRGKGLSDLVNAADLRMIGFGKCSTGARALFDIAVRRPHS